MVPTTAVLGIMALLLFAITSGRAYAAHEADLHLLMNADHEDDDTGDDAALAGVAKPSARRTKASLVGSDIRTLELQLKHALDQAPDGTCELKFYGAGVVAVCE